MILNQSHAYIPSPLRKRACFHRQSALEALRGDMSASFRLSRYWSHISQARALEALERAQKQCAFHMLGGVQ